MLPFRLAGAPQHDYGISQAGQRVLFRAADPEEKEIIGIANFSNVVRGSFHACYLGYSIGQKWQGQGLMYEALTVAIRYMQRTQHIHRIMANYMPHNQRSGNLLARLGSRKRVTPKTIC